MQLEWPLARYLWCITCTFWTGWCQGARSILHLSGIGWEVHMDSSALEWQCSLSNAHGTLWRGWRPSSWGIEQGMLKIRYTCIKFLVKTHVNAWQQLCKCESTLKADMSLQLFLVIENFRQQGFRSKLGGFSTTLSIRKDICTGLR
jgi:hypothetical protein